MKHLRLPSKNSRNSHMKTILVLYTLATLTVMSGFIYKNHLLVENYRRTVVNNYRNAFNYAAGSVAGLDSALQKCAVSGTSGMAVENCVGVYGAAQSAKQAIGELPNSDRDFEQTSGFISKVADYALALAKKAGRGTDLTDEEVSNLKSLSDASSTMSQNFAELMDQVNDGRLTLSELDELTREASEESEAYAGYGSAMKYAEREFPELPTLIYDGPFSEHIAGLKPLMLEGKEDVDQDTARLIAQAFTGYQNLTSDGERAGTMPVYMFAGNMEGGSFTVEVTKQGGIVSNIYSYIDPGYENVSVDDAVKTAEKYLRFHGFADMKESYHMTQNGVLTVNFAHTIGDVTVYPDLVKVVLALDTGKVIGFEAQGYVMHHHEREIPEPAITIDEARSKVSKQLEILSEGLAIIPTSGENEVFCYEFKCESEQGEHFIVYIDAQSGQEQQILHLLETDSGVLAQ